MSKSDWLKSSEEKKRGVTLRFYAAALAVLFISAAVVWLIYESIGDQSASDSVGRTILLDLAKLCMQLALLGVVGVGLKALLSAHEAAQAQVLEERARERATFEKQQDAFKKEQADRQAVRMEIWRGLRSVYGEVEKARNLIEGAKSARTYGQQIRRIMDLRTSLGEARHEVLFAHDTFREKKSICCSINKMEEYLDSLIAEYGKAYPVVSGKQRQFEKDAEEKGASEIDMDDVLSQLEVLQDFRQAKSKKEGGLHDGYVSVFRTKYQEARELVLKEMFSAGPSTHHPEPEAAEEGQARHDGSAPPAPGSRHYRSLKAVAPTQSGSDS